MIIKKVRIQKVCHDIDIEIWKDCEVLWSHDGHWSVFDVNEAAIVTKLFDNLSKHIIWTLVYILHTSVLHSSPKGTFSSINIV